MRGGGEVVRLRGADTRPRAHSTQEAFKAELTDVFETLPEYIDAAE